ncbi:MAG: phosphodiester glycosidase family protein [Clostridia bacterium]|nr:phosphodiester glycosidase family protein [Clostridia bacterium]
MRKGTRTKKTVIKTFLHIGIALLLTAAMLGTAALCALFVIARGPSGNASERLCATMQESGSVFTGLFFDKEEQRAAAHYYPPKESVKTEIDTGAATGTLAGIGKTAVSGKCWKGYVISGIDPAKVKLTVKSGGATASAAAVGLEGEIDAVLYDGVLTYAGDGGDELYCVCAMDPDGVLHIGGKTTYEIANSGYTWAISASRVLVADGKPLTDLGGGYAARAAIGQKKDGSIILVYVKSTGFYPCGITFDELASIMYEWGAVNAAALTAEGGMRIDGSLVCGNMKTPGYSIIASAEGTVEQ